MRVATGGLEEHSACPALELTAHRPISTQLWPSPAAVALPPLPSVPPSPTVHYGGSWGSVPAAPAAPVTLVGSQTTPPPPPTPPPPGPSSPAGRRYVSGGILWVLPLRALKVHKKPVLHRITNYWRVHNSPTANKRQAGWKPRQ
eukprot:2806284-Amphidinium_carterae.2